LSEGSRRARSTAVVLGLLSVLALVPLAPGEGKYHALELAIAAVALTLAPLGRPVARLVRPLAALAAWTVTSLVWSLDARIGFTSILWIAALVLIGGIAASIGASLLDDLTAIILLVATAAGGWGLLQAAELVPHDIWADRSRLAGLFANSNIWAAFVGVAALLAIDRLLDGRTALGGRLLAAIALVVASINLLLTASRGGWLATAGGLAVLLSVRAGGRRRMLTVAAIASTLLVLTASVVVKGDRLAEVGRRLTSAGTYSVGHRARLYLGTLAIIRAHPFGVGAGNFRTAFPAHRIHSDRFAARYAHSEPLELAASLGIPGLALAGWALGRAGGDRAVVARMVAVPRAPGALAALTLLGIHSLFDFPLRKPIIGIIAAALVGALIARPAAAARRSGRPGRLLAVGLAIGAAPALYGELLLRDSLRRADLGDLRGALALLDSADRWFVPRSADVARSAGDLNARLARLPLIGAPFVSRAGRAYDRAIARSAFDAPTHIERATIAMAATAAPVARKHAVRATELAPRDGAILRVAATILTDLGDHATGHRLLGRTLETTPVRTLPRQLALAASAITLPPELIATAPPADGAHADEYADELAAVGLEQAARLYRARIAEQARVTP